jgi:hypothetical protein
LTVNTRWLPVVAGLRVDRLDTVVKSLAALPITNRSPGCSVPVMPLMVNDIVELLPPTPSYAVYDDRARTSCSHAC